MDYEKVLGIALKTLDNKKAEDLSAVLIKDITTLADVFVIATATSTTHVRALAAEVEEKLTEAGMPPHHIEGRASDWLLIDCGSVVIHIFTRKSREFYGLDHMWSDGTALEVGKYLE